MTESVTDSDDRTSNLPLPLPLPLAAPLAAPLPPVFSSIADAAVRRC